MNSLKLMQQIWDLKKEAKESQITAQIAGNQLLQKYAEGKEDGLGTAYDIITHTDYVEQKKEQTPVRQEVKQIKSPSEVIQEEINKMLELSYFDLMAEAAKFGKVLADYLPKFDSAVEREAKALQDYLTNRLMEMSSRAVLFEEDDE